MARYQIAQVNIARMKGQLDDLVMAGFVARLSEINALADHSPGFVWRLQTPEGGDATYLRPYDDDRILVNMSVWETIDALRQFVYKTAHVELIRQRQDWFDKLVGAYVALWWVPVGHTPGSTKRRSGSPTLTSMVQASFRLASRQFFSRTRTFNRGSTGHPSSHVRQSSWLVENSRTIPAAHSRAGWRRLRY